MRTGMMNVRIAPRRRDCLELLDQPHAVLDDLPANLRDIRRLNAWFGGTSLAWRLLGRFLDAGGSLSLLDVATGSADIPLALQARAARCGQHIRAVGLDSSAEVLSVAAGHVPVGSVELVHGDALALPWPDASFDVALCCLALHHFGPPDAQHLLSEMWRTCRRGLIVIDLRRSYAAYAGTWLATRTVARNRLTQHDGPLSTLRAYTLDEVRVLASEAGLQGATVQAYSPFRLALVACKQGTDAR